MLVPTESVLLLASTCRWPGARGGWRHCPSRSRTASPNRSTRSTSRWGAEIGPKRYLVGVVRREVMADWVERAEAAGLGQAAMVPDALALPVPPEGAWSVDLGARRAVVRVGDGTGFACSAALLRQHGKRRGARPRLLMARRSRPT
ncbi:MAG: type II secretion system protein GspL [Sphingomonas sp.]